MKNKKKDDGSYLTGLSIGLFAGTIAYLLYGTSKGREVKKKLKEDWSAAQELIDDSSILDVEQGYVRHILRTLYTEICGDTVELPAILKKTHRKHQRNKTPAKFKGV